MPSPPNLEVAITRRESTALTTGDYRALYSAEALQIIRATKCRGATDEEFGALMMIAAAKRLSPLTGQIHFVKRKSKVDGQWVENWVHQTGIDGFRLIAERTGDYDGQDEPEFILEEVDDVGVNGKPTGRRVTKLLACKVKVYRKGINRPFVGVAYFDEYVQTYNDNGRKLPNTMWATKPRIMISKCAEALALRKSFPEELGGLEAPEEFGDDHQEAPAAKFSVPGPASAPAPVVDLVEIWGPRICGTGNQEELDRVAAELHKVHKTEEQRKELGRIFADHQTLMKKRPAEAARPADPEEEGVRSEPCGGCETTDDNNHAAGCPNTPTKPEGKARK